MASVSSLDHDMRRLRMERYTAQSANEVRSWIEDTLGERLSDDDLLEGLRDGVALCKLANLVLPPPGIKYKASSMPFTQRENISQFLRACESLPLSLQAHDRFLTVDLYDGKDPAQVIQCLGAFSRAANAANPSRFPKVIGPKRGAETSPTRGGLQSGVLSESRSAVNRQRGSSNASQTSDSNLPASRTLSPSLSAASKSSMSTDNDSKAIGNISSWSSKSDEARTAPAWNIHQYGYMGGASQGNQGISFGARRQITSPGVSVPSLAEKERRRKEEAERVRREDKEQTQRLKADKLAQERREADAEAKIWQEETEKAREQERQQLEQERRRWEEEERRWKEEEEQRRREEEQDAEGSYETSDVTTTSRSGDVQKTSDKRTSESDRIKELERQLEEAKERERRYLENREQTEGRERSPDVPESDDSYRRPETVSRGSDSVDNSWAGDEKEYMVEDSPRSSPLPQQKTPTRSPFQRPLPDPKSTPAFAKPLDAPRAEPQPQPPPPATAEPPRPLPDPTKYRSPFGRPSRTDQFLNKNPAPVPAKSMSHFSAEMGMTSASERAVEDSRRAASQTKTKASGWASKSLMEKEMERERERQREWEENQMNKIQSNQGQGLLGPRELKR